MSTPLNAPCPVGVRSLIARVWQSPLAHRLAHGALWALVGSLLARVLNLAAMVIVARLLGKKGFGEFGIVQSTVSVFSVLAGISLGITATKYVAEFRVRDPAKAGRIAALAELVALGAGALAALALYLLAPWLATRTLAAPQLGVLLRYSTLIVLLSAWTGVQTGILSGLEAFRGLAYVGFWAGLLSFPVIAVGTYADGLRGAVLGLTASLVVTGILNHLALRKEMARAGVPLSRDGCTREWSVLWHFSLPSLLGGLLTAPAIWACNAMLVNRQGGYADMGLYTAALRIKQIPEMVVASLLAPLLPVLSDHFGRKDVPAYNQALRMAFLLSMATIVPLALIQAAVPSLTLLPYGQAYQGGHTGLVQWLMLHAVLIGLYSPMASILASMSRMWFGLAFNLAWAGVFVLLSHILVPAYGAMGLASATALTHLVTSLPCVAYIYRYERAFIQGVPLAQLTVLVLILFFTCAAMAYVPSRIVAALTGMLTAGLCLGLLLRWGNARVHGAQGAPS
jgi:O-antigen/teichoic acid export membrane protein